MPIVGQLFGWSWKCCRSTKPSRSTKPCKSANLISSSLATSTALAWQLHFLSLYLLASQSHFDPRICCRRCSFCLCEPVSCCPRCSHDIFKDYQLTKLYCWYQRMVAVAWKNISSISIAICDKIIASSASAVCKKLAMNFIVLGHPIILDLRSVWRSFRDMVCSDPFGTDCK